MGVVLCADYFSGAISQVLSVSNIFVIKTLAIFLAIEKVFEVQEK